MKPFILLCMLCAMGSAGVWADQVTLQVTGTIRGAGCEVDSASKNLQIALGDAPAGSFQQAGKTGDWINFQPLCYQLPGHDDRGHRYIHRRERADRHALLRQYRHRRRSGAGAQYRRSRHHAQARRDSYQAR